MFMIQIVNKKGSYELEHLQNTIVSFTETAKKQEDKGIAKYGKPLDPLDNYDWLKMAKEEQVDGYKYLEAEIAKRKFICNKIRKLTNNTEILFWLDELEGK